MALSAGDTVFCTAPVSQARLFDLLAPVRDAGFTAISVTVSQLFELETRGVTLREVRTRIADAGLQVAEVDCIACWLPEQEAAADAGPYGELLRQLTADRVIAMAEQIGARSVSLVELFNVGIDRTTAAERFAAVCDRAAESGLLAAIEFLPVGGIPTLAAAAEIVRGADRPNGGLMVDAYHLFRSGSTLAELESLPASRIVTVQVCDAAAAPQGELADEMMTARLTPGEGGLDVVGMLRTLRRMGAVAPIGVEVFNPAVARDPVRVTAGHWMRGLRSMLQQAEVAA